MLLTISSVLLTGMFFMSGFDKIMNFTNTSKGLSSKPFFNLFPKLISQLALIIVIIIEIVGPILIVMGSLNPEFDLLANLSSLALAAFTVLATLLYHFPPNGVEKYFFMKNVTIVGGLLALSLHFGGIFALSQELI